MLLALILLFDVVLFVARVFAIRVFNLGIYPTWAFVLCFCSWDHINLFNLQPAFDSLTLTQPFASLLALVEQAHNLFCCCLGAWVVAHTLSRML